ncbi:MAG: hypothetical protein H6868_05970 [Rhodospirillales bacterium]|nr:hypothetical protein [Rhodospirillales bacterium]
MSLSILSPSRCVLLVSDEVLSIYDVTARTVKLVDTVSWDTEGVESAVADIIRKECKGKPVLILNDMTDQHFKGGQKLPKVGVLDKQNVLRRKLQVAFPNYPIRAALPMKPPRSSKAPGGASAYKNLYLFAAVPLSAPIAKTMKAVRESLASIAGLYMLPVEASDMVKSLSEKVAEKKRPPSTWTIFIGQHQNGALRQVIIRDGQLAMTRMTPVIDTDTDHEQWAQEVFQEFKATVSYLSRFGFSSNDSTDVIVVSHPQAGELLEEKIDIPCQFRSYTVTQAASILGMKIGTQASVRYADPLHVAWAGRKNRFIMPLFSPDLERVHKARQGAMLLSLLLLGGACYLGWQLWNYSGSVLSARQEIRSQREKLVQAEQDYNAEKKRMADLGVDVELIRGTVEAYDSFEAQRIKVLPVIKGVVQALGPELRLDSFLIKAVPPKTNVMEFVDSRVRGQTGGADGKQAFEASLKLSFPRMIDPEKGVEEVNELRDRLQEKLPAYEVVVERNLIGLDYSAQFSGSAGVKAEDIAKEDYVAEIQIRGVAE